MPGAKTTSLISKKPYNFSVPQCWGGIYIKVGETKKRDPIDKTQYFMPSRPRFPHYFISIILIVTIPGETGSGEHNVVYFFEWIA